LIRLGDGEGALSQFSERSRIEDVTYLQNHFGPTTLIADIEAIRLRMEDAIQTADIIGVRDDVVNAGLQAASLNADDPDFVEKFKKAFPLREIERQMLKPHSARRIFQLYRRFRQGFPPSAGICSQWVCYDLALAGFWEELFAAVPSVTLVSCTTAAADRIRKRFGIDAELIQVPQGVIDLHRPIAEGAVQHFPAAFGNICSLLSRPHDGKLFLVGAGLIGKHYLNVVKQHGGIAIDIGALIDAWDGLSTRGLIYSSKVPLLSSQFACPAVFRLGPGRLARSPRSERRLVLHIGFSKTGTTAIQVALANAARELSAEGVSYVRTGRRGINHHELARAFGMGEAESVPDRTKLPKLLADIREEIAKSAAGTHVISTELLTNTSPHQQTEDDLIEFISSYNTMVVACVRNQFDWLLSWYRQSAKNGNISISLREFLSKQPLLEKYDGNFLRKLSWFERYLPGSVKVFSYDQSCQDVVGAFLNAARIAARLAPTGAHNVSPPPIEILTNVAAKRLGVDYKILKGTEWTEEFKDVYLLEGRDVTARSHLRAAIEEQHKLENAELERQYGAQLFLNGSPG
jgi:hypothetical protein